MSILSNLVKHGHLSEEDVPTLEREAVDSGNTIETVLQKRGVEPEHIVEAKKDAGLGVFSRIPRRDIDPQSIPFDLLKYIPEESALHYRFVPIGLGEGVLEIGIVDPDNLEARDALNFISAKIGMPFKLFVISLEIFQKVIEMYKGLSGEVNKALGELQGELSAEQKELARAVEELSPKEILKSGPGGTKVIEEAPVSKIVATILRYAIEGGASDVHIEPLDKKVRVRFRVDGELHTSLILPATVQQAVAARIKILSNMKLDEKRKPQDGRFSARIEGREVDFRVSTFPTYYGEKVVMRILDKDKGVHSLEQIGLSARDLAMIRRAITKPYGMILISGPTGSGKSTTLYSMLNEVDRETQNVLSLEDPVEYNMEGISQSQVRPEIDYTFATGLRTTLRQDPDVIMVGEIRDRETAQLAVQAALTGHLVLSTIHTNNAVGVVPRLIDMGVDPFLIAPTLILSIAQRLTRKLCPNAGKPIPIEGSLKAWVDEHFADLPEEVRAMAPHEGFLYGVAPSSECPNGTRGRVAVFEMFEMDQDLERCILKNPTEYEVAKIVRGRGMLTMQEDAIIKSAQRIVPFEEINSLA